VASSTLRWLATVETTSEPEDLGSLGGGMSEGMGLVVVVTGSTSSPLVAQARSAVTQDETLVVVCAIEFAASSRFVVDATSVDSLISSWTVLIHGSGQVIPA